MEELCEVMEVGTVNERVMTIVSVLEEYELRLLCGYST